MAHFDYMNFDFFLKMPGLSKASLEAQSLIYNILEVFGGISGNIRLK
jgi:hypothetical protein